MKESYDEYIRVLNQKCKQNVDRFGVNLYNVEEISQHSREHYWLRRYHEVEVELLTKRRKKRRGL